VATLSIILLMLSIISAQHFCITQVIGVGVSGNIQWVHKDVNKMKSDFAQEYFVKVCTAISEASK